jgi:hypothetical protein
VSAIVMGRIRESFILGYYGWSPTMI